MKVARISATLLMQVRDEVVLLPLVGSSASVRRPRLLLRALLPLLSAELVSAAAASAAAAAVPPAAVPAAAVPPAAVPLAAAAGKLAELSARGVVDVQSLW